MAEPVLDERLLEFLRSVAAGTSQFRPLDKSIDINTLPPNDCLMFGLPPRPAPGTAPLALWQDLATSRVMKGAGPEILPMSALRTGYNRLDLKGHQETSRNWSGAVIASPYRSRPFDCLIGIWAVPDFRLPAQATEKEYACSTWIGFDGHRRNSRSLPQLGTVQRLTNDGFGNYIQTIKGWRQWWYKNPTIGPIEYSNSTFPVSIGDRIVASLFFIPNIGVLKNMINIDTGIPIIPVLVPAPDPQLEPRALDAECVLERPKRINAPYTNFVAPQFEDTTFRCYASLRGETGFRTMNGARLIRMIHRRGPQIETIAAPDPVRDRKDVTVRYCLH